MKSLELPNLSCWQLASTLGTAMGFPVMLAAGRVAGIHGAGTAILSIVVGNLILWLVGMGVVSMSQKRSNAVENVKSYLGGKTGIVAAILLALTFFVWYIIQIQAVVQIDYFPSLESAKKPFAVAIGGGLGLILALIGSRGIRFMSHIGVIALPILVCFAFVLIFASKQQVEFANSWKFSFPGTVAIVFSWLPATVNLPTYFRHSYSREDSFFAISVMTLIHMFFQISFVISGYSSFEAISQDIANYNSLIYSIFVLFYAFVFYVCINLANIYFASAGWDTLISNNQGRSKFFIMGLLGTIFYMFFSSVFKHVDVPSLGIENMITGFISFLGIVLLIDYLISVIVKHRPRSYEKFWSSMCWLVGCVASVIGKVFYPTSETVYLVSGISASLLSFLVVIFVEETIWSIRNLDQEQV